MNGTQKLFVNRVQIALGWCMLLGLIAAITAIPDIQRSGEPLSQSRTSVLEHSMVIMPLVAPEPAQPPIQNGTAQPVQPVLPQAQPVTPPANHFVKLPPRQRVHAWFSRFDAIRKRACMTPMEKATAIKLWATSFVSSPVSDKDDGQQLLRIMVQRYDRAIRELSALPEIPETRALQQGYMHFFKQAHISFQQYLHAFDEKPAKEAIAQMAAGRRRLASIDAHNKMLDRHLRKRWGVPEIK